MTFYEISITDTEGNDEVLWSSEGVQIAEPATSGFRAVRTLRVTCVESFSNTDALRAFKKITGFISPEILELDGFDELDTNLPGHPRAVAKTILEAANKPAWARFTTLSLVNCTFLQSYERRALTLLFNGLPANVHTLKLSGEVALEFDVFDPAMGGNVPRLPLDFATIDMSELDISQINEVSAFTESYMSRCMRREGRHADRTTPPRIIFPSDYSMVEPDDSLDEIFLETPMPCCYRPNALALASTAMVYSRETPLPAGPATFDEVATTHALREHLRDHLRALGLYRGGFVQLFEHIVDGNARLTRHAPTPDEFAVSTIFLARVLVQTTGGESSVVDIVTRERHDVYAHAIDDVDSVYKVLPRYRELTGLTTPETIDAFFPEWTDETSKRWARIMSDLSVVSDVLALGMPRASDRLALWAVDTRNIDLVNAPRHIAETRAHFRAFQHWPAVARVVNNVVRAFERQLATPVPTAAAAATAAAAPVARLDTIDAIRAVSIVHQWMCAA